MSKYATFDSEVLKALRRGPGGTAYYLSNVLRCERKAVSEALCRLKKRGLVHCDGRYWKDGAGLCS